MVLRLRPVLLNVAVAQVLVHVVLVLHNELEAGALEVESNLQRLN